MKFRWSREERRNDELDEELRSHVVMAARDLEERGLDRNEAERRARRDFGNETLIREATRDAWGGSRIEQFIQDVRYGVRGLRRNTGFACACVLSLALGIGANVALFSVTDATLNRDLPFPEAERLVTLSESNPAKGRDATGASPANALDWREAKDVFSGLTAFYARSAVISEVVEAETVSGAQVTADFFSVFRVPAVIGRTFTPEEFAAGIADTANNPTVGPIVISERLWDRRFARRPDVLGRNLSIDGVPRNIIGVMPSSFAASVPDVDVWLPWDISRAYARLGAIPRDWRFLKTVARMREGVELPDVRRRLETLGATLATENPATNAGWRIVVTPLRDHIVGNSRATLLLVFVALGLVLLLTASNVAGLQIARGMTREREVAVRLALGVSRGRLIRQFLTESIVLCFLGGATGIGVAALFVGYVAVLAPKAVTAAGPIAIDFRVLTFALATTLAVTLIAGLWPSLRTSSVRATAVFRGLGSSNPSRARGHYGLVAMQVAIAVVLFTGALLLGRSVLALRAVDPGFTAKNRLVVHVSLNTKKYATGARRIAYFDRLTERLRGLPGTTFVGGTTVLPMSEGGTDFNRPYWRADRPRPDGAPTPVDVRMILPTYVDAMDMRIVAGRNIALSDDPDHPIVVMVNEELARRTWPGESPVGKSLVLDYKGGAYPYEVVGVVNDTRYYGLRTVPRSEVFIPYRQNAYPALFLVIESAADPRALTPLVRQMLAGIDPTQPAQLITPLESLVDRTVRSETVTTGIFGAMAVLALLLAAVGIFGVVEFGVTQSRKEIGLRIALGARARDVMIAAVRQAATVACAGSVVGLIASFVLASGLESFLFGVSPHDPLTLMSGVISLFLVAIAAAAAPARRASSIDPAATLRAD